MKKSTKYAANFAIGGGVVGALSNVLIQLNEMDKNPNQKFDFSRLFLTTCKGAAVGGAGGYVIGSIIDYNNSREIPLNTDAFLYDIINGVRLNKSEPAYVKLNQIAEQIINVLQHEYKGMLSSAPLKLGSTEKGTALKDSFDIDISLAFKPNSFSSTKEMYYDLQSFLESSIGSYSITRLRDQKKSIGVYVMIKGIEYKIDIVPCKITQGRKTAGYLHVNDQGIFTDRSSYTKTDIHLIKQQRLTKTQQDIIILLKKWRNEYNLPLSSHLLENLVCAAYKYNYGMIPKVFTAKVLMVLKYIANNLDVLTLRSIENTNNILTDFSESDKDRVINACIKVIEEYEYQPNSIIRSLT